MTSRYLPPVIFAVLAIVLGAEAAFAAPVGDSLTGMEAGWTFSWPAIWARLSERELVIRTGVAFTLCFTLGVQLLFFPAYYWGLKLQPSSAIRLAYFTATLVFLAAFVWLYYATLFATVWRNGWILVAALLVVSLMILWLILIPKKQLA